MQRFKILGALMLALLAIGAMSAGAAQAKGKFGAESYTASLTAGNTSEFTFYIASPVRPYSCTAVEATGQLKEAGSSIQMSPEFGGCHGSPGASPTTINVNGCTYNWELTSMSGPNAGTGTEALSCPGGNELEVVLYQSGNPVCVYGLASQGPSGTVTYANTGSGSSAAVELTRNVSGTATVLEGGKAACGASVGGTVWTSFSGSMKVSGTKYGVPTGVSIGAGGVYLAGQESAEPSKQPRIESEWGAESFLIGGDQSPSAPHLFKVGAGVREFSCSTAHLGAVVAGADSEVPLTPEYSGCIAYPGALPATIGTANCGYTLHVANVGPPYAGSMDVACNGGAKIEMKVYQTVKKQEEGIPLCSYQVGSQSGLQSVGLENVGSGIHRGVGLNLSLKTVSYTKVSGTAIACGATTGTLAYTGSSTLYGVQ